MPYSFDSIVYGNKYSDNGVLVADASVLIKKKLIEPFIFIINVPTANR